LGIEVIRLEALRRALESLKKLLTMSM